MRKTSKDIEMKVIKSYQNGMSMSAVGKEFSITSATVLRILNTYGIEKRTKGGIYRLDEKEIIKKYKKGNSASAISKEYGVTEHTITNIMEKFGVKRDNIYYNLTLNNDYWNKIDRYDKAYFLGFLITDGNVCGNRVSLMLNKKDIEILNVFSQKTGNTNLIGFDKRNMAVWGVKRKKWVDDLAQYGVIPRKTAIAYMPKINEELMPHLIRGLIDGDGWISKKSHQIGLCGNETLITQVRDFLVKHLGVYNVSIIHKETHLWQITWASDKDIKTIGEYIYKDKEECFLQRKFHNFIDIINVNTEVIS